MIDKEDALAAYEQQYVEERTEAKKKLEAKKKVLLDESGPYDLSWFSPPGEALTCEHVMPRLVIRGGLPLYMCDDCDHYLLGIGASAFIIPKQHVPSYSLMLMSHYLQYEGPKALAQALVRPHHRIDLPDAPSLPPVAIIEEMEEMWKQTLEHLSEYKNMALEAGKEQKALEETSKDE